MKMDGLYVSKSILVFFRPPIGVLKIFIDVLELIITCYDKIVIWFLWKWKPAERFFRYRKNDE